MPNHIENHLTIEGPQDEIDAFVKKAAQPDSNGEEGTHKITLHAFVPMPADIFRGSISLDDEARLKGKDWYSWSVKNWGTKWDAYQTTFRKESDPILDQLAHAASGKNKKGVVYGRVLYTFQTAWSAPMPVIEAMAAQHPDLKFKHEWSDEDTHGPNHGRQTYEDGRQRSYQEFDCDLTDLNPELEELATRLHGENPYQPRCEYCGDYLDAADKKKFGVSADREGCCAPCKPKHDKDGKYPLAIGTIVMKVKK